MKVFNKDNLDKNDEYYVALGSFDGLHKGHLSLIHKCIELSKKDNCKSMVFTFSNHPRTVINPNAKMKYLMNNKEKLDILKKEGIDKVVLKEFNKEFMELSPEGFIRKLCSDYKIKGIVVGFNYRFGHKNLGDINLLKEFSSKYNYKLEVISPLLFKNDVISSTRIRNALSDGEVSEANKMLTRPYSLTGIVEHGKNIGRTLIGFPTANLKVLDEKIIPAKGVYYTNVKWKNNIYKGITSVGSNPTVNGNKLTIETFILDFDNDIYDDEISIYFIDKIRNEKKFNSIDCLKEQLKEDEKYARSKELAVII
ncbi:bifunctional riboflavin kinase/FAD synthetase [Eubacterium multiforme]|uniref:Riboflavin biosynthesis protein n=1 Tax=Eubacterium multiforme TaxID=83339 RepID=A0ABT9UQN5_9FIRM|nr:bifunctional riboflavin kinase/FAD synthetase [Eubacterium multiforme]MDQ0148957.1 riboflavin kinase/FMN adenylyltransferase [Eubacterium multiforme]